MKITEYGLKINQQIIFSSDKTLEELGELEPWELFKEAWTSKSRDFFGNGLELWERIFTKVPTEGAEQKYIGPFKTIETSRTLEDHHYTWSE